MPVFPCDYKSPPFFGSGHLQTVYPTLCRKIPSVHFRRERIETPDGDFLDLDWSGQNRSHLAILSHGLEGNSQRIYMTGMARALNNAGIDALCWNFRGCSGVPNRKLHYYHSGLTVDLNTVLQHALDRGQYRKIWLIGFSIGGNITLKYLGEQAADLPPEVQGAIAFSVPCDLASSSIELAKPFNRVYMRRFLKQLHEKIRAKMLIMPGKIDDDNYHLIRNFQQFDDRYTAPLNGFRDAADYWQQSSCIHYLDTIRRPALLVNARNDSFLSKECYPVAVADRHPFLFLEMPEKGGHVGFIEFNREQTYWLEKRAVEFIRTAEEQAGTRTTAH